jgi:transketolase
MTNDELKINSIRYRIKLLKYIKMAGAGHTGGSLSCVDILNVLYNRVLNVSPKTFDDPGRDRYIQSKGHSVEALYVVLADKGFFPESDLETLCRYGSHYVGHPTRKVQGIEQNTGALGHGLAFGVGGALAGKMDGAAYRVYTLLGDGELAEGSNWESMMAAAHYHLDNLTTIIDRNTLQITGYTHEVCDLEPLEDKLRAFGWSVRTVAGHDIAALSETLGMVPFEAGRPNAVIARTVKGKGISFMENDVTWHHRVPDDDQYERAQQELNVLLGEVTS